MSQATKQVGNRLNYSSVYFKIWESRFIPVINFVTKLYTHKFHAGDVARAACFMIQKTIGEQ